MEIQESNEIASKEVINKELMKIYTMIAGDLFDPELFNEQDYGEAIIAQVKRNLTVEYFEEFKTRVLQTPKRILGQTFARGSYLCEDLALQGPEHYSKPLQNTQLHEKFERLENFVGKVDVLLGEYNSENLKGVFQRIWNETGQSSDYKFRVSASGQFFPKEMRKAMLYEFMTCNTQRGFEVVQKIQTYKTNKFISLATETFKVPNQLKVGEVMALVNDESSIDHMVLNKILPTL